jgi:hypothetical protein
MFWETEPTGGAVTKDTFEPASVDTDVTHENTCIDSPKEREFNGTLTFV